MKPQSERTYAGFLYRKKRRAEGSFRCDVCAWAPPSVVTAGVLEAHHVVPVRMGGGHHHRNLVLLCPNHHRIADKLGPLDGRDALIASLRLLDADPEAWALVHSAAHAIAF